MSTATANPTETTLTELPIVSENRTYSRVGFKKVNDKGETEATYKVMAEDDAKAAVEADVDPTTKLPTGNTFIDITQTFAFDHGNTVEALQELFNNDKELCKQTNNAIDVKLGNRVRSILLAQSEDGDFEFVPVEGSKSLREYIGQETAARGKTDLEKMKTIFSKLPEEQKKLFFAMFQQAQSE